MFKHVLDTHLKTDVEGFCRWEGCEKLQRKKWSLVTHVQVIVGGGVLDKLFYFVGLALHCYSYIVEIS